MAIQWDEESTPSSTKPVTQGPHVQWDDGSIDRPIAKGRGINPFSLLDRATEAAAKTEQTIQSRSNPWTDMMSSAQSSLAQTKANPLRLFGPGGTASQMGSQAMGTMARVAESVPANIGLGIQQRRGVGQTFKDVVGGLAGQRPAELDDIARASGLPVISSAPVAAAIGLVTASAPGLFTKTGRALAEKGSELFTPPSRKPVLGKVLTPEDRMQAKLNPKIRTAQFQETEAGIKQRAEGVAQQLEQRRELKLTEAEARKQTTLKRIDTEATERSAQLERDRQMLDQAINQRAKAKTVESREAFHRVANEERTAYREKIEEGIQKNRDVEITSRELYDGITEKFNKNPIVARNFLDRLGVNVSSGEIPDEKYTARQILGKLDSLARDKGKAAHAGNRVYTEAEKLSDDALGVLGDLLESKGITEIRGAKTRWKSWARDRDRAIKVLRPYDPEKYPSEVGGRLIRGAAENKRGQEIIEEMEKRFSINLTDDVKAMLRQLDAKKQEQVLAETEATLSRQQAQDTASRAAEDIKSRFLTRKGKVESAKERMLKREGSRQLRVELAAERQAKAKSIIQRLAWIAGGAGVSAAFGYGFRKAGGGN